MNGPALAVAGARVALVWYTQGGGSRVQIAWSEDGGRSFGAARRVDAGGALGRVDACAGPDGRVLATWLRRQGGASGWSARAYGPDGAPEAEFAVAAAEDGRGSGILRLAHDGEGWIAAWTADGGRGLRAARILAPLP